MKTAFCALLFVTFLATQVMIGQTHRDRGFENRATQELIDLENRWLAAEGNPDVLESILAPDFLHVVPSGIISKRDQLNFMREHPSPGPGPRKYFEDMHVRVYRTVGIVNGVVVEADTGSPHKTLFTDVFAYRDGRWQAINAQELPLGPATHWRILQCGRQARTREDRASLYRASLRKQAAA